MSLHSINTNDIWHVRLAYTQYIYCVSECSVQCAIGTRNCEMTVQTPKTDKFLMCNPESMRLQSVCGKVTVPQWQGLGADEGGTNRCPIASPIGTVLWGACCVTSWQWEAEICPSTRKRGSSVDLSVQHWHSAL